MNLPDCHLILDLSTRRSILLLPNYPSDHALWSGPPPNPETIKTKYQFDECVCVTDLPRLLQNAPTKTIHVIQKDQVKDMPEFNSFEINDTVLKQALIDARVYKDKGEILMMKKAAKITGDAHIKVMKAVKAGLHNERECHALFEYECMKQGYGIPS